jgi:superfamily II DNA or RNA helicase
MIGNNFNYQVEVFKSLFKGREDVFAIHWEKGSKAGYIPAYFFDRYLLRKHKIAGGTFQNYSDKKYLPLTDLEIEKHIGGEQHIGIYPLLQDNTSWFIAADFDKENWFEECKLLIAACRVNGISAYLERSRSGRGGHVWIFFEQPYPAIRSRKIIINLLEQSGIFSIFDKSSSFDRLFPNQDYHSGKGLGNLIALPLFKKTLDQGNSCFIDPNTESPFANQWQFLKEIRKITTKELDDLYQSLSNPSIENLKSNKAWNANSKKIKIELDNVVKISRSNLPMILINFLKEELNFMNSEYIIKSKVGRNTFGTERYFRFIDETEDSLIIPRGFIGKLIRFCKEHNIEYDFVDNREKKTIVDFLFNAPLREHQQAAVVNISKKDLGVIVSPPGSGKTVIALKAIAEKNQSALIIIHRKQIAEQWIERIQSFLGIPKNEIGKIGNGKTQFGKKITVAMIHSLAKALQSEDREKIVNQFGLIIVDECHHIPAETFRKTIAQLKSYYMYGLTATAFRKYNDGKLIFIHLGEIISEIKETEIKESKFANVILRNTSLEIPFNPKTDTFETLSKILVHDSTRNKLILHDVVSEIKSGKKIVILTERKEHIDSLNQYLKQSFETITLSGDDSECSRYIKWKLLKEGNYQALITTGQFFGEGTDLKNANCLFLVYPFSFEGKLIQYLGRVQRSEVTPTIYDYRDIKIDYLNKMFLKRNTYYRKIQRQATLFDEYLPDNTISAKSIIIDRKIKVPFEELEFRYGSIAFQYKVPEVNAILEFDIDHHEIRPEFEVLKSYFSKALGINSISVDIHVEFDDAKVIAQLAASDDILKINREIVEAVKFKFINKNFLSKVAVDEDGNLLDISKLNGKKTQLYASGEELLEDLLKNTNYKHYNNIRYLADNHARQILKLRFVLQPFSFVFLIVGKEEFHFVLETLDTEEATYIWHFENNVKALPDILKLIDKDLSVIRNKGRQIFLENPSQNFSRIVHDYSDEKKGFIIWRDLFEEQLI